jgi:hypothetical protein
MKKVNSVNEVAYTPKPTESNKIILRTNEAKEILRFHDDELFLYGEKVEIHDPKVIEGFRTWMSLMGHIK